MPAKDRPRRKAAADNAAAGQDLKQDETAANLQTSSNSTAHHSSYEELSSRRSRRAAATPPAEAPGKTPAQSKAAAAAAAALEAAETAETTGTQAKGKDKQAAAAAAAAEEVTPATKQQKAAAKGKKGQKQSKQEDAPPTGPGRSPAASQAAHVAQDKQQQQHQQQQEEEEGEAAVAEGALLPRTPHAVLLARGERVDELSLLPTQIMSGWSGADGNKALFEAAMAHRPPLVTQALEEVLKAPVMQGKTIIFSAEPDAFKPITKDSPGIDSQQLKCTRGVVHTSGKIMCSCGLKSGIGEFEDHLPFQLEDGETKLSRLWLEMPLIKLQDLPVMCADPGTLKVSCVYCTSATPESGSDTLIRCWLCNAAFHKTCYEQASGVEVGNPFDMNCISCREPGPCAALGCRWCLTVLFLATPSVPAAAPAAARVAWTTAAVAAVAAGAVAAAAMAPVGVVVTAAVAAAAAVAATVTSGPSISTDHSSQAATASSSNISRKGARGRATTPEARRAAVAHAQAAIEAPAQPAAATSSSGGQAESTDSSPSSQLEEDDTAGADSSELDLGKLKDKDWVLPKWKGLQAADAALVALLEAAGNADELRAQLFKGFARLQNLPADDEEVEAFEAGYRGLRGLGLAVRDAMQACSAESKVAECKAQFETALLMLLSEAEGGQ